ncbi:Oidioi.mRNA.OKI2018_I69.chr1.g3921.t1.cds [Oikopleura dioica]|uniref:Oidioi.mRNA.OKI2018_I69.chr1.g3921.t1.cds n=1 Tax=Oikopleura dioica TaxID=34765 RepID=A0ABN7SVP7_OIKDI|nr:Oidioi.mRNA.OKI2018_I69.chr1.g3921.t1.cds [Oikopleura dioica]
MTVTEQPEEFKGPSNEFRNGLFSCCSDVGICCKTCWCPCLSHKAVNEKMNQPGTATCLLSCWCPITWFCISSNQRGQIRKLRGIDGSAFKDFLLSCCCLWCVMIQNEVEVTPKADDQQF